MTVTEAGSLSSFTQAPDQLDVEKDSWATQVYEVTDGTAAYARLDYSRWTGKCHAQTATEQLVLGHPKGLRNIHSEVRDAGTDQVIADVDLDVWKRGGSLVLDGETYQISSQGVFGSRLDVALNGVELFAMQQKISLGKSKGDITLTDAGRKDPHIGMLMLIGMHMSISANNHNAVSGISIGT